MPNATCPLCGRRRAKRLCPALGRLICAVCCGTKRGVEIRCPEDCAYLLASHAHPPAAVQRQRERDLRFFARFAGGETERAYALYLALHSYLQDLRRERGLRDDAAREAVEALHQTYETLARGVIYEFRPVAGDAQAVVNAVKAMLAEAQQKAPAHFERDAEEALRRTRDGFQAALKELSGETAYLDAADRFLRAIAEEAGPRVAEPERGPSLIEVPGRTLI